MHIFVHTRLLAFKIAKTRLRKYLHKHHNGIRADRDVGFTESQ